MLEKFKTLINLLAKITNLLRKLPYGEDGKYIHFLLGSIFSIVCLVLMYIPFIANMIIPVSTTSLIILGYIFGLFIEFIQRILLNGKNTTKESLLDALWVPVGGAIIAIPAHFCLGIPFI